MQHLSSRLAASARPFQMKLSVTALLGAGLLSAASVWAQDIVTPVEDANTVTVSCQRRAAQSAQTIKMNSDEVVDSIVAEEAGKFPDKNVAEMLGRVTGVQIRREFGEATRSSCAACRGWSRC